MNRQLETYGWDSFPFYENYECVSNNSLHIRSSYHILGIRSLLWEYVCCEHALYGHPNTHVAQKQLHIHIYAEKVKRL